VRHVTEREHADRLPPLKPDSLAIKPAPFPPRLGLQGGYGRGPGCEGPRSTRLASVSRPSAPLSRPRKVPVSSEKARRSAEIDLPLGTIAGSSALRPDARDSRGPRVFATGSRAGRQALKRRFRALPCPIRAPETARLAGKSSQGAEIGLPLGTDERCCAYGKRGRRSTGQNGGRPRRSSRGRVVHDLLFWARMTAETGRFFPAAPGLPKGAVGSRLSAAAPSPARWTRSASPARNA
jgi:hypothetical protein